MEFQLEQSIDVLRRTPGTLSALLRGLGEAWIQGNEGSDTFSPFDVVGHLIDGEETDWIPRARRLLTSPVDVVFEPYDRFRHVARNRDQSLDSLLDEFSTLRKDNLQELRSWTLTDAQLELRGEHPSLGTVTLRQLLSSWVVHDLGHIAQIVRVMAKQYETEIGPWRQYSPILGKRRKRNS